MSRSKIDKRAQARRFVEKVFAEKPLYKDSHVTTDQLFAAYLVYNGIRIWRTEVPLNGPLKFHFVAKDQDVEELEAEFVAEETSLYLQAFCNCIGIVKGLTSRARKAGGILSTNPEPEKLDVSFDAIMQEVAALRDGVSA